jgi:hypothetical protein
MRRTVILAAAAVVIVLTVAVAAVASIPDNRGVIHGCRDIKTGALRVIDTDAGQTCTKNEAPLNWSQGTWIPVRVTVAIPAGQMTGYAEAICPYTSDAPAYVTGGGFGLPQNTPGAQWVATSSRPDDVSWIVTVENYGEPSTQTTYVTAMAQCMDVIFDHRY